MAEATFNIAPRPLATTSACHLLVFVEFNSDGFYNRVVGHPIELATPASEVAIHTLGTNATRLHDQPVIFVLIELPDVSRAAFRASQDLLDLTIPDTDSLSP